MATPTYHELEAAYQAATMGGREPDCLATNGYCLIERFGVTKINGEAIDPRGIYLISPDGIERLDVAEG